MDEIQQIYKCSQCDKIFKNSKSMKRHEGTHLKKLAQNICEICNKVFDTSKEFENHKNDHPNEYRYSCSSCTKRFLSDKERFDHESKHKRKKKKRCRLCPGLAFESEKDYFLHIKNEHEGKILNNYMCSECGKQFRSSGELVHHNKSKCGTIKQYKCKVCGVELMNAGSLHNHMLIHKGERKFMCRFCAKQFLTRGQLKVHERIHTQDKPFVCTVCGKGFCHRQSLITHSTLHTGIKPYQCEYCGNSFSCVGNLLKHRKTHADTCGKIPLTTHRVDHPSTKRKVRVNTPETTKLKYLQKQKEFKEKLEMLDNRDIKEFVVDNIAKMGQEDNEFDEKRSNFDTKEENIEKLVEVQKDFDCDDDGNIPFEFDNDSDSESLGKTNIKAEDVKIGEQVAELLDAAAENPEDVKNNSDKKVRKPSSDDIEVLPQEIDDLIKERGLKDDKSKSVCRYCNKFYSLPKCLLKHEKRHESIMEKLGKETQTFCCSCCKAPFATKDECIQHQNSKHADLLTCKDCMKIFSNPHSLRNHNTIYHSGQPRKVYSYICDKCGMQFKLKSSLKQHTENDCLSGPLFQCEKCDKKFSSIHVRKAHMVVHDEDKKLTCSFCPKTFHWKGQLKIHERVHTGEKPFACLYCPKKFAYRESLVTHSSIHTGIRPHFCKACGVRFSCIGNLIKHRNSKTFTCGAWYAKYLIS